MDVTVLTSVDHLSEIKSDWDAILKANQLNNFYYSFDWIHAACHFFIHPVSRPFIVCIREDNKPIAIIPCCITRKRLRLFSYNSLELIGNIYSAYRGGIVLKGREADVAQALFKCLKSHRRLWDIIHFEDIPGSSFFLGALHRECHNQHNMINRITDQYANLIFDITPGMRAIDYWQSRTKNHRQNIRSAINKMNRDGRFTIVLTSHPDQNVHAAMDHFKDIFKHSWRKEPEISPLFHRQLAEYLASKGKLRLFVLYFQKGGGPGGDLSFSSYESAIDAQQTIPDGYVPIATSFFAVNRFYAGLLKTAYREDYSTYSAGTVLSWFSIKWLLDVDNVNLVDFQKEDDAYKFKWGRFNDMHVLFQAANPRCPSAMLEIWAEKNLIPLLRKIKKTRLWPIINNFLGQRHGRTFNDPIKHPCRENGAADR